MSAPVLSQQQHGTEIRWDEWQLRRVQAALRWLRTDEMIGELRRRGFRVEPDQDVGVPD